MPHNVSALNLRWLQILLSSFPPSLLDGIFVSLQVGEEGGVAPQRELEHVAVGGRPCAHLERVGGDGGWHPRVSWSRWGGRGGGWHPRVSWSGWGGGGEGGEGGGGGRGGVAHSEQLEVGVHPMLGWSGWGWHPCLNWSGWGGRGGGGCGTPTQLERVGGGVGRGHPSP